MPAWYDHDLWKAYAGWLSPVWASPREDFDAARWVEKLGKAGFRTAIVHAKHHDGVCFYPSEFRSSQPPRDYFGELVREARKRTMRVVAYYSTIFDTWSADVHPEWACRERDGSITVLTWPPFPVGTCCHHNPGYRDFLFGQLDEIQKRYRTDGFWLDGLDYTGFPSRGCWCHFCQERYRNERGGSLIDQLLDDELRLWQRDGFYELFREVRSIASDGSSAQQVEPVVVFNNAGANLELGYERIDELCTHNSQEAHTPFTKSLMSRLLATQKRPFEIYSPVSDVVFSWTPRTTEALTLEAAIVTAHGGTCLPGLDITPSGYIPHTQLEQCATVSTFLREREQFLHDAKPLYDVGLLLPKESWKDERGTWAVALLKHHVPFALLPLQTADFAPCKVIVVADGFRLSSEQIVALERYVEDGGSVLVERDAAGLDCNGGRCRLSGLLGVESLGHTGFETHYVARTAPQLAADIPDAPVRSDGEAWRVTPTSAVALARYAYPVARYSRDHWIWREPNPPRRSVSTDAAVTVNGSGAGRAAYVACLVCSDERPQQRMMNRLGANLVRWLSGEPAIEVTAPSGIEVVLTRQEDRWIVHLLNHDVAASGRWGDTIPEAVGVIVRLNENRLGTLTHAWSIPDGAAVKTIRKDGWISARLLRVGVSASIAFEA